jgi:hypothetical protein
MWFSTDRSVCVIKIVSFQKEGRGLTGLIVFFQENKNKVDVVFLLTGSYYKGEEEWNLAKSIFG